MKRGIRLSLAALVWIMCARNASAQWPYVNNKLKAKSVNIRTAVILPAQVAFNKQGAKGSEGMTLEAEKIGGSVYSAVSKELALRGITVLPNPLDQVRDDASKYAIADLQARYDNIAVQVRRKPGHVEKGRFTLGDRVARFEPGAAADVLVFLRGVGLVRTPARKAISLATWGWAGLMSQFRGELVFADARTGEVLAFVRFNRSQDYDAKVG